MRKASKTVAPLRESNDHKSRRALHAIMQAATSLQAGMMAPDFKAPVTTGKTVHLSDYRGKKVVLYFYPKDDTPGCTVESCGLRDQYQKIRELGAERLGVSVDDPNSHQQVATKLNLPCQPVPDTDPHTPKTQPARNET